MSEYSVVALSAGRNDNVPVSRVVILWGGGQNTVVTGLYGGGTCNVVCIINRTAAAVTFQGQSSWSQPCNRLDAGFVLFPNECVSVVYDPVALRWLKVGVVSP